jgi:hypothetical protein
VQHLFFMFTIRDNVPHWLSGSVLQEIVRLVTFECMRTLPWSFC